MTETSKAPNNLQVTRSEQVRPGELSAFTTEDVAVFRRIVREETGVDMSEAEAWNRAIELVDLFRMLIGRIPEDGED